MRRAVAAFAVSVLAVACASSGSSTPPEHLRIALADDWASTAAVSDVVESFEQRHEEIDVRVDGIAFSRIPAAVREAEEDGRPYDLAQWHAFAAGARGEARPLDEQWAGAGLQEDDYLPGAVDDVTWDGRRYGVPLDVNALVLLASESLLGDAGVEPGELATLEGFRSAVPRLVDGSARHALALSDSTWVAYGWIVAAGGGLVETEDGVPVLGADGLPTFTFDDEDTIAALELLAGLVARGEAASPKSEAAADAVAGFADGTTALHLSGSWDLPSVRRDVRVRLQEDDVLVLPMPQADPGEPRTVLGGSSLFVPSGATNPESAFEFALALTDLEVGLRLAEQEGRLPALARAYDTELFTSSESLAAFVDQLSRARVMSLIAFPALAEAFEDTLEDVLTGTVAARPAMRELQERAERWVAAR